MIFISSGGLIYATGNQDKFTPDFIIDLIPNFNKDAAREADPFSGTTSTAKWNNGGGSGVEIEFLNALDDSWQVIFALAIADWEFGTPDALTLKSEQIAHEVECEAVQGKIKVCNGNYGETNWRGINLAVLDSSGFITSSSAKMNQYYLDFDPEGAKQYTVSGVEWSGVSLEFI